MAVVLAHLVAQSAYAQQRNVLPEINITPPADQPPPKENLLSNGDGQKRNGAASKTDSEERCGDAGTAGGHSLECLNEQLKRKVDQVNPTEIAPPLDARSQDIKVGTVNIPGVQQQYGQNFGHSVIPFRPPPLIYSPSLGRR
jgi:hypothetical protein